MSPATRKRGCEAVDQPLFMEYAIDDNPARVDLDVVWRFLSRLGGP
jgi:hypothetical protein